MKLCLITCYKQPDYIRARTLRAAARAVPNVDVVVVKNARTGLIRYAEVCWRVLVVRLKLRPDAYLLTFRGYEMLLPVRLLSVGKPLIYDEFINPIEWASYEHLKVAPQSYETRIFRFLYRLLLQVTDVILTDTESHAELSSRLTGLRHSKFHTIPVGTDETTFDSDLSDERAPNDPFNVFYYGNMLPLHGLRYVIEAAQILKDDAVRFVLIGGDESVADQVAAAQKNGASIEYKSWVPFEELPGYMRRADLCLAGPFGNTFQSQYVITGKAYQYMAMGRPVVVGANKESGVFADRVNAFIVPQASTEALAETIRWSASHRDQLSRIGREGQRLYQQQFALPALRLKMQELLARVTPA